MSIPATTAPRRRFLRPSLLMMRDALPMLQKLAREHGDVVPFKLGLRNVVLVNEPELIRDILVSNAAKFEKGVAGGFVRALLGDSLLTSQGKSHLRQRRLVQPAFHRGRIAGYAAGIVARGLQTVERWRDAEERDVGSDMSLLTLEVVAQALFTAEVSADANAVEHALETIVDQLHRVQFPGSGLLLKMRLPIGRRLREAQRALDDIVYRLIRERKATGRDAGDLLSMLMLAEDAENPGERLSDEEVRDQAMTLFLAGHETAGHALAWTWWQLASHPDAERALHEEIDTVLGQRPPTFEDLPKLKVTESILRESMRLYPPAWAVGRMTIAEHDLRGFPLRPGTLVLISQWVLHRDPRFYVDPEVFRPERWTPEFRENLPRFAYLAFGTGPRTCIGEGFAWTELILLTAVIAQRWQYRLTPRTRAIPQHRITLRPQGQLRLRLEKRT